MKKIERGEWGAGEGESLISLLRHRTLASPNTRHATATPTSHLDTTFPLYCLPMLGPSVILTKIRRDNDS